MADHAGDPVSLAALVPNRRGSASVIQEQPDGDLHDMIPHNGLEALPSCDVVPLELILRRVDPVLTEELVDVEQVEEAAGDGIDYSRQYDCEDIVGYPRYEWCLRNQHAGWAQHCREGFGHVRSHLEAAFT